MLEAHRQTGHQVRFDWGLDGADAVAASDCVAVLVDVLSFSTTLTVAADLGVAVLPYLWRDETATAFAEKQGATLAVDRSDAEGGKVSLSPASLRSLADPPARLVLPSPNGSTIAWHLERRSADVIGGCLRNASAVADWVADRSKSPAVAVIAAGERWPDGELRPCLEDALGAGAVISALVARGWSGLSPEAQSACAAYEALRGREADALHACAGGLELIERGYSSDVDIAVEVDESTSVPRLDAAAFISVM